MGDGPEATAGGEEQNKRRSRTSTASADASAFNDTELRQEVSTGAFCYHFAHLIWRGDLTCVNSAQATNMVAALDMDGATALKSGPINTLLRKVSKRVAGLRKTKNMSEEAASMYVTC